MVCVRVVLFKLICSELIYDILRQSFDVCSCSSNDNQHGFVCPNSSKHITLRTVTPDSQDSPTATLAQLPQHLPNLSRVHQQNPFHLTISSRNQKITILCLHPDIITQPGAYHSFVATQCFVDVDELPSSDTSLSDFTFIGAVSGDYCSTPRVRKAISKVRTSTEGYKSVREALLAFARKWILPVIVALRDPSTPPIGIFNTTCQRANSSLDASGVSVVELTRRLVLATQRGRACADGGEAFCKKWQLLDDPQDVSHEFGDGYLAYNVAFETEQLWGWRLIMVPKNIRPEKTCYYIFCVYGCTDEDNSPRWLSSHPYELVCKLLLPD